MFSAWSRLARSALFCAIAVGCYRGSARDAVPAELANDPSWLRVHVPEVRQTGASDCGAAALGSVLAYWGRPVPLERLQRALDTGSGGASAGQLQRFARAEGLEAYVFFAGVPDLEHELAAGRPVIVGLRKPYLPGPALSHYEVVVGYERTRARVLTLDPARGLRENGLRGFLDEWEPTGRVAVVAFPHISTQNTTK